MYLTHEFSGQQQFSMKAFSDRIKQCSSSSVVIMWTTPTYYYISEIICSIQMTSLNLYKFNLHISCFNYSPPWFSFFLRLSSAAICYLPIFYRQVTEQLSFANQSNRVRTSSNPHPHPNYDTHTCGSRHVQTHTCTWTHTSPFSISWWQTRRWIKDSRWSCSLQIRAHTCKQTHTYTVQSRLWQDMRNQFLFVTPTYRSQIIIKSNWYTLLNILVFDLGSLKFPTYLLSGD